MIMGRTNTRISQAKAHAWASTLLGYMSCVARALVLTVRTAEHDLHYPSGRLVADVVHELMTSTGQELPSLFPLPLLRDHWLIVGIGGSAPAVKLDWNVVVRHADRQAQSTATKRMGQKRILRGLLAYEMKIFESDDSPQDQKQASSLISSSMVRTSDKNELVRMS